VTGVVAAIVTGDRPGPIELAGIAAMLVGIGIVSVGGASAASAKEPARQTA
jgi:drug/metabolite transporter (DMT)-like permease